MMIDTFQGCSVIMVVLSLSPKTKNSSLIFTIYAIYTSGGNSFIKEEGNISCNIEHIFRIIKGWPKCLASPSRTFYPPKSSSQYDASGCKLLIYSPFSEDNR